MTAAILTRWTWPENPDYTVHKGASSRGRRAWVTRVSDGEVMEHRTGDPILSDFARAAEAFFNTNDKES